VSIGQAIRNALTDAEVAVTNAQVEIATRRQELASTLTAANQAILDFQAQSAPFMSGMG